MRLPISILLENAQSFLISLIALAIISNICRLNVRDAGREFSGKETSGGHFVLKDVN